MVAVRLTLEQPVHSIALSETAFIDLITVAISGTCINSGACALVASNCK
jgi:hypothetical protein